MSGTLLRGGRIRADSSGAVIESIGVRDGRVVGTDGRRVRPE